MKQVECLERRIAVVNLLATRYNDQQNKDIVHILHMKMNGMSRVCTFKIMKLK